ncbi:MAG: hypothetical protein J0I17_13175 ['Candidatus Kapabacteria' thiocyanatum]|nr:hypothetical protein ['Candidatus Kapabacteria' thiocyanatum]
MSEHQQDPLFSSLRSLRRSEPLMSEADIVASLPRRRSTTMKTAFLVAGLLLVGVSTMWFMRDDRAPDGSLHASVAGSVRHGASAPGAEGSPERTLTSDTARSVKPSPIRSRGRSVDAVVSDHRSSSIAIVRHYDGHADQLLLLTQDEVRSLGFIVTDTSMTMPMKTETEARDVVVSTNGIDLRRRGEVTDGAVVPLMIGVRKNHARDEERVSFGDISMSSVLLGLQWDVVSAEGTDTSKVTAWCVPTVNLIAALPDRYRVPVMLELDLLREVERGCLSPAEACQSIPYGKSYVNKELCDRSKRTIIDVDVYPDPAQSEATCRIDLRRATTVRIALYRESGSFLGEACQESRLHEGHNELALILGDYEPGAYLLMAITADGDRMVRHLVIYR